MTRLGRCAGRSAKPRQAVRPALPMGGEHRRFALADEAAWIAMTGSAEQPDVTGRRSAWRNLHARGVEVSYYGVRHFLDHAGAPPVRKKPACHRAGPC